MTRNPSAHKDEELLEADRLKYEVMAIIDPDVGTVDYKKDFDALKSLIENHGGFIWNEEEWGKRELAYSIKKKDHGFYVVVDFDADPSKIPEIIRQLKITPFVVRSLLVKLPDEYVPQHYDLDEALQEKKPAEKGEKKEEPKTKPKPMKKVEPKVEKEEEKEEVVEKPEPKEEEEEVGEKEEPKAKPKPEPTPEPEEEEVKEEPVKAKEDPAEEEPKPKKKVKLDDLEINNSEKLSKLDKRLEELLSGKDDLNL